MIVLISWLSTASPPTYCSKALTGSALCPAFLRLVPVVADFCNSMPIWPLSVSTVSMMTFTLSPNL